MNLLNIYVKNFLIMKRNSMKYKYYSKILFYVNKFIINENNKYIKNMIIFIYTVIYIYFLFILYFVYIVLYS
jgi:hypothetical protein